MSKHRPAAKPEGEAGGDPTEEPIEGFEYPLRFPLEDVLKDIPVGCSACGRLSPRTPRQIEADGLPFGWQLRLLHTHIAEGEALRWDLYCHACATEASPRPPESVRISMGA